MHDAGGSCRLLRRALKTIECPLSTRGKKFFGVVAFRDRGREQLNNPSQKSSGVRDRTGTIQAESLAEPPLHSHVADTRLVTIDHNARHMSRRLIRAAEYMQRYISHQSVTPDWGTCLFCRAARVWNDWYGRRDGTLGKKATSVLKANVALLVQP